MRRAIAITSLAAVLAVGGCTGAGVNAGLPAGPGVVAVPGSGKELPVFQQEDAACRAYAAQQIAGPPLANNGFTPGTTLQQRYDITYTQCMYSKGNTVLSSERHTGSVQVVDVYPDAYPFYGSLFGPGVFLGYGGYGNGRGFHPGWGGPRAGWAVAHGWGGGWGSTVAHGGGPAAAGAAHGGSQGK